MSLELPEPPGSAARQCHHSGQTLGKGLAWTVSIGAAEPAGRHSDRDRPSLPRQIMEHAPIDAVDAPGCHAARRAFGGSRAGRCLDGDMIRGRQHTGHLERPRDERQQGRGHGIGTMDVSPGLSPSSHQVQAQPARNARKNQNAGGDDRRCWNVLGCWSSMTSVLIGK